MRVLFLGFSLSVEILKVIQLYLLRPLLSLSLNETINQSERFIHTSFVHVGVIESEKHDLKSVNN